MNSPFMSYFHEQLAERGFLTIKFNFEYIDQKRKMPDPQPKLQARYRTVVSEVIAGHRSEEHTSELQSRLHLVCRLLLEKKKKSTPSRTRPPNLRLYRGSAHPIDGTGHMVAGDSRPTRLVMDYVQPASPRLQLAHPCATS